LPHDGATDRPVVLLADATEKKLRDEALLQSESRYRAILDTEPECVKIISSDGRMLEVNAAGLRMMEADRPDQVIGRRAEEWIHPDDRAAAAELHRKVCSGESCRLQHRMIGLKGTVRWMETHSTPWRDPQGELAGVLAVSRDVSDRKQAEQSLRDSEERFRLLARATNDAIWDWDPVRDTAWWSDGLETLFGHRPDDMNPPLETWLKLIHPEDRQAVSDGLHATLFSDRSFWSAEYRFQRKDGTYAAVHDRGHILRDADRRATRMIGGMSDVTSRRNLEAQFLHAQKMEAVGRLAGGIAHDFNNLLTIINGYTETLLPMLTDDDARWAMLAEIREAGLRAANLTRQLLAFSRKQVLSPQVLDLNSSVKNTVKMLSRLIGEDVRIQTVTTPVPAWIRVDPGQLEQVILNLAVNARDAMPKGGRLTLQVARVAIGAEETAQGTKIPPGEYVALDVADTGSGMAPEVRARIFEPFFTTKEPGLGTGLGLATVFGIVQQSDAHIDVETELGVGTRFRILFPAARNESRNNHHSSETPTPTGTETLLLVEDESGVRRIARMSLERYGYKVLEAADGREAIELFAAHAGRVQLVITDVVMPEMGGAELVEQLRRHNPGLKTLYISGHTEDAAVRDRVSEASESFLQKPFTPTTLARKVREVLDGA
jgi:PAS domain S-box-containing protein